MTVATSIEESPAAGSPPQRSRRALLAGLEIDTRLLGMIAALLVMWFAFNQLSDGLFLSPRNLWNLSVQTAAVAIMTTGTVLIIVSRNIDLSVGSILVFCVMVMGLAQTEWIPQLLGPGFDPTFLWIAVLLLGIGVGAVLGGLQGILVAYFDIPSFIVTLGGLLIWRGAAFQLARGRTVAPLDSTFQLLGGGPRGSIGDVMSWVVGGIAIAALVYGLIAGRRRRQHYGFQMRPRWADAAIGVIGSAVIALAVAVINAYPWPPNLAHEYALANGITEPPGGLIIPTGIAIPVLLAIGVAVVMTVLATRRRFGRHVYAIGGNPEAAELAGINTKRTILKTFVVMGMLSAIAAAVISARLNAAAISIGTGLELQVIAAAIIGGTSFAGGTGTIFGGIIGALIMQSLSSGMVLIGVDTASQDIVVGLVLVGAVGADTFVRRRAK